jgi:hypothetical protein
MSNTEAIPQDDAEAIVSPEAHTERYALCNPHIGRSGPRTTNAEGGIVSKESVCDSLLNVFK